MARSTHEAIRQLKYRYCMALDDGDVEAFGELFTNEVSFDIVFEGETVTTREDLRRWLRWRRNHVVVDGEERRIHGNAHVPVNHVIEADGDQARAVWYYLVFVHYADGTVEFGQGRYRDRYERVDGDWKIRALDATRLLTVPLGEAIER